MPDDDDRPDIGPSRRQMRMAAEGLGSGPPTQLFEPDTKIRSYFTDEQVAATAARVHEWVRTGKEPPPREPGDGFLAVAAMVRSTFAGDAAPPALNLTQLADVVRTTHIRAEVLPGYAVILPLAELPPAEYAAWRATAAHTYNCVVADAEGIRETPLAERERTIVAQARQSLGA